MASLDPHRSISRRHRRTAVRARGPDAGQRCRAPLQPRLDGGRGTTPARSMFRTSLPRPAPVSNPGAVVWHRSTDGGKKWTNVEGPRIYDDTNCYPRQLAGTGQGRQTLTAQNYRIHSFPMMAVDTKTGRVHVTWTDDRAHPSCGYEKGGSFDPELGNTQNQVFYIQTDDGVNFSAPVSLTAPFDDNIYPAVAARDGNVLVGYSRASTPRPRAALGSTIGARYVSTRWARWEYTGRHIAEGCIRCSWPLANERLYRLRGPPIEQRRHELRFRRSTIERVVEAPGCCSLVRSSAITRERRSMRTIGEWPCGPTTAASRGSYVGEPGCGRSRSALTHT